MDSQHEDILISVVIPVKNGAAWIGNLFPALAKQTLADKMEIICIDSGSDDGSTDIIRKYPVRLIEIKPEDFNHGETRNMGVRVAKGKFVVMTVQDALPADDEWLQKLLDGFDDENVAGVCGQQIVPHDPDKNPVQWFRPVNPPSLKKYTFQSADEFDALPPSQKKVVAGWDDVTACYRKSILLQIPFRRVSFAEDALWAMDAVKKGYSIVYNTAARVQHYHFEDSDFAFRRSLTVFYHRYKYIGYLPPKPSKTLRQRLSIIKTLAQAPLPMSKKWFWWKYNRRNFAAKKKAYMLFTEAVGNDISMHELYDKYCRKAPQASKNLKD